MAKTADMREVALTKLKPYERNAKIHGDYQLSKLKDSIREFGFITPLLIDRDYNLIAGHGRVMAAQQLGMETVPCVFVEGLTDAQRRAYILADNKLGELGEWDMDIVTDELTALADEDFDISLTGFDLNLDEPPEVGEDDYDETRKAPARAKRGDIYQLGRHRLMCGDSVSDNDMMSLMNGTHADISVTSPPYNADHLDIPYSDSRGGGTQKSTQKKYLADNDNRTDREYFDFLCSNIDLLLDHSDEVFYNIGVGSVSKKTIANLLNRYQDDFKDLIYWVKDNPMPVIIESVISSATELVICFGNNGSRAFNHFNDRMFHGVINGHSASVTNEYADIHKATFPVYLPSEIITRFSPNGGTVIDCFGGTGTTMIACEQLGRSCYMMELEPRYVDVIIDRWEQFTGGKAVLLNG